MDDSFHFSFDFSIHRKQDEDQFGGKLFIVLIIGYKWMAIGMPPRVSAFFTE
jgi:hypothetical protein